MSIDWTIVFATLAGPIMAVWASEWRAQRRSLQDQKMWVCRTLWSTRSANLHPDHVSALNHMDFVCPEKDYPTIADAWHLYFAQLNTENDQTENGLRRWQEKASSLLSDLIHLMASKLKIPFPKSLVNQPSYYPKGWSATEAQQNELRVLLLEALRNQRSIHMNATVFTPPQQ